MRPAKALLMLAATAGCYGMPLIGGAHGGAGGSGSGGAAGVAQGGSSGASTTGGSSGSGGAGTTDGATGGSSGAGSGGIAGSLGGAAGGAGVGSGSGGSKAVFVGGPCIAAADATDLEVFSRSSDGHIYRRAYDGTNWGSWSNLMALDGTIVDARSDLDCSATSTTVHLVATGLNPVGALLHAFGSATAYNPFLRELPNGTFGPSASIGDLDDSRYTLGALVSNAAFPAVYEIGETPTPHELTPIATAADSPLSAPDIAVQPSGASKLTYFAAFDSTGALAVYCHTTSSGGSSWAAPMKLSSPSGTFAFSPTICTENGVYGITSVNVVAVAGGELWYSRSVSSTAPFSAWTMIGAAPASAPDCIVVGPDSIVHVVALSFQGTVLDVNGKGTTWVATDLGLPR